MARGEGFVERRVYPLVFLRPFRCRLCRARFYRFSLQNGSRAVRRQKRKKAGRDENETQKFAAFLKPQDDKEFQQLIKEIREAERKILGPADHTNRAAKSCE